MKTEQRYAMQSRADWWGKVAAVGRLARLTARAIDEAEEVPEGEQLWGPRYDGDAIEAAASAAAAEVIRAMSDGNEPRLAELVEEHSAAFVMAARQFAQWLGLAEDLT